MPENFALLEKNVAVNGYQNVVLEQAAVCDQTGSVPLYLSSDGPVDHRIYQSDEERAHIDVPCVSLDEYFARTEGPVHVVKMDIQGAEAAAVRGMTSVLGRADRVTVVMEFWPFGTQERRGRPLGVP